MTRFCEQCLSSSWPDSPIQMAEEEVIVLSSDEEASSVW